jgi:hypothetical protein
VIAIEEAAFIDWRRPSRWPTAATRAYLGHETCEGALPSPSVAQDLAARLHAAGRGLTLVTPFLTARGISAALRRVDVLQAIDERLEVVCGDLGLLARLAREGGLALSAGRVLAVQPADPRLLRLVAPLDARRVRRSVRHVDGTLATLTHALPSPSHVAHLQGTWLDRPDAIAWFRSLGVTRGEVSNVGQGLATVGGEGWSYSLHVPWVIVSVLRACPSSGERVRLAGPCAREGCTPTEAAWYHEGFPVELRRRDNALVYEWPSVPDDLPTRSIDRIVRHVSPSA